MGPTTAPIADQDGPARRAPRAARRIQDVALDTGAFPHGRARRRDRLAFRFVAEARPGPLVTEAAMVEVFRDGYDPLTHRPGQPSWTSHGSLRMTAVDPPGRTTSSQERTV